MKKIWLLKVLGICLCVCISIFLFTTDNNGQPYYPYGYQQSYNPYAPYQILEDPYGYNPYLEDDYRPPPDFSNWNWTDPWTAYDPSGGGAVAVNWQPEYIGTSPYFQQIGYNPYNWNMPYNYGWNQPSYGWNMPYINVWNQPYTSGWNSPFNPGWNQPYINVWNPYTPTSTSTSNIEAEEYLVYSALIEEKYPYYDLTISDHTSGWEVGFNYLDEHFEGLERKTFDNYEAKNAKDYTLKDNFTLTRDYELIDGDSDDAFFALCLSRVGFNSYKNQAIVYGGRLTAPLAGSGSIFFLIKEGGVWKVESGIGAWIS